MKRGCFVALLWFVPTLAQAHEVLHAVERGKAIAVKAYFADGEVLAYSEYQVFSPTDPRIPYQKGRSDRAGYVAFVPDAPGKWRVKISDTTGHGLDLEVEAAGQVAAQSGTVASWAFAVRPILGVVAVAAVFSVLVLFYRRKGASRG